MISKIWLALCLALAVCAGHAAEADKTIPAARLSQIEQRITVLDQALAVHKHTLQISLEANDKRLADFAALATMQGVHTTWVGTLVALVSMVFAVLVFGLGFMTYYGAKGRAETEAEIAGKKWFETHTQELKVAIEKLQQDLHQVQLSMANPPTPVTDTAEVAIESLEGAGPRLVDAGAGPETAAEPSAAEPQAAEIIRPESEALAQTPDGGVAAVPDEIRQPVGHEESPGMREQVATALLKMIINPGTPDKVGEAMAVYDDIEQRSKRDESTGLHEQAATALFKKGFTLGTLGKHEEAIAVYDEIDRRYGEDPSLTVREQVAKALVNKGFTLDMLGKSEAEMAVYDEIVRRFGQDQSPGIREQVAKALVNKSFTLDMLGRAGQEMAVYDEIDRRFGDDDAPGIRVQVAKALNGAGYKEVLLAKEIWSNEIQRRILLASATLALERSAAMCDQDDRAMVLGNLGYGLFLVGQTHAARESTYECLKLGGPDALDTQRCDTQQNRIEPEDSQYEKLLDELWHLLQPPTRDRLVG